MHLRKVLSLRLMGKEVNINIQLAAQLQCFKELFLKHYSSLCVYALRFVDDSDACKDIVQDCFITLWEKRAQLDFSRSLRPLLYKSVHDRAIDYTRHAFAQNTTLDEAVALHPLDVEWEAILSEQIIDELDCKQIVEEVNKCLDELTPYCAGIYRMSREEGLSNKEIAERLKISVKAVEKQMTKVLSAIRTHLMNTGYLTFIFYALLFLPRK